MSIQTELTRLTNAKSAIKAAIEGKGVTVPASTLLDGMAALIESIEAGGGSYATGSFTVASKRDYYTIQHDLGEVPTFALIYAKSATPVSGDRYRRGGGFICIDPSQSIPDGAFWVNAMPTGSATGFLLSGSSNNGEFGLLQSSNSGSGCQFVGVNENSMQWQARWNSYFTYLLPGVEYKYMIGVF